MEKKEKIDELRALSVLFDSRFEGPFGLRFGLDALLGLIPGIGDVITSAISVYIIFQAAALGCGPSVLARMALNVLFENVVDLFPFIGNFFDFFWKANNKNMALLEAHVYSPEKVTWQSRILVALVFLLVLGSVVGSIYLTVMFFKAIINWAS